MYKCYEQTLFKNLSMVLLAIGKPSLKQIFHSDLGTFPSVDLTQKTS